MISALCPRMITRTPVPNSLSRRTARQRAGENIAATSLAGTRPGPPPLPFEAEPFRRALQSWYRQHARDLPWRGIRNPYGTWLSEIMLQQTRVATVVERYNEFMRRFPTLEALAGAGEEDVLALWSGLGYYRRAHLLHRAAQFVQREFRGRLPRTAHGLRTLPGVGEYTAAAIASIAFGESVAVLDGNVERVLLRILGLAEDRSGKARARLSAAAQALVPPAAKRKERSNPPGDHNQAMMELGATICLPRQPLCLECPVMSFCRTRGEHATAQRDKPQSRIVAHLLTLRKRGTATEVLLLRRPTDAALMPRMLELPPLPLEAIDGREPVLRLRHAITNTNYYVQIFAESAPGVAPHALQIAGEEESENPEPANDDLVSIATNGRPSAAARAAKVYEEGLFVPENADIPGIDADPRLTAPEGALLGQVPASKSDLDWTPTSRLAFLPLTGLTRKVLQRLGVMSLPRLQIS
ncbi:MAG TPA: A/G-specific adenine glycosylase [Acidobacteriaceae bacterium]|nr:A/G-specific adenine glycosylase [Acidobacteriaceae bacterium]